MNADDGLINEYGNACLGVGQFQESWNPDECQRRQRRLVAARSALSDRMVYLRAYEELIHNLVTEIDRLKRESNV